MPDFANCFQLCSSRRFCYLEHHSPVCFQGLRLFYPYEGGNNIIIKKLWSAPIPTRTRQNAHRLYRAEIAKTWTDLEETANLAQYANLVFRIFCSARRWNDSSYWANGKKDLQPREQSHHLGHAKGAVNNETDMDNEMRKRPNPLNAALWLVTNPCLDYIPFVYFHQHTLRNVRGLDPVCIIRTANEQTASNVPNSSVFSGRCE